ncbi:DUF2851 family protein [Sphingobacterium oryzagri]|uniref:DUF2851 family protein n=1 Tax=Sphingobacterium oryzagri TaxID=3025669 RepID=A0ABY7WKI7_9SPHI|nr:DUF2851 family protein [Sphingobacterium sp. KACC 22765]WDF70102.1 DUF2851 family protein [Sphingobacterium sp. KACC 22765]
MIAEELLHFIWQFRLFNQLKLFSTAGEPIKIHFVGEHNNNAGPDFIQAKLAIAGQYWHGCVELHVDGRDWMRHKHHQDEAYNSVILHVVFSEPVVAHRADGTRIPCLVLRNFLDEKLLIKYQQLMDNRHWIACEAHLPAVADLHIQQLKGRMLVERLERNYHRVLQLHEQTKADWEKMLFLMICRSFGMKVNAEAFLQLGEAIDLHLVRKYIDEPLKQQALFFGQAGFLTKDYTDDYAVSLKNAYTELCDMHRLAPLSPVLWKQLRMRPANFPTFRLGQLIGVYGANPYLFAGLLACETVEQANLLFQDNRTADYWTDHYQFDRPTRHHETRLSDVFTTHLAINAFVPILFTYGKMMGQPQLEARAFAWLEGIKAEHNHVIAMFAQRGITSLNAADSQALLQLKKSYCDQKKCLECCVGLSILKA